MNMIGLKNKRFCVMIARKFPTRNRAEKKLSCFTFSLSLLTTQIFEVFFGWWFYQGWILECGQMTSFMLQRSGGPTLFLWGDIPVRSSLLSFHLDSPDSLILFVQPKIQRLEIHSCSLSSSSVHLFHLDRLPFPIHRRCALADWIMTHIYYCRKKKTKRLSSTISSYVWIHCKFSWISCLGFISWNVHTACHIISLSFL